MSRTGANIDFGPPPDYGSKAAQQVKEGLPASSSTNLTSENILQQEKYTPSKEKGLKLGFGTHPSYYLAPEFRVKCINTLVKELAPPINNVVIIRSTDSVSSAFQTLINYKIVSAPLLDVNNNLFVAFLHLLDILAYVVDIIQYQASDVTVQKLEELIVQDRFKNTPVTSIIQRALRNPWYTINENAPLQEAIDMFDKFKIYQIAVSDSLGRFSSVLTQFRVLVWIANRSTNELGDLALEPIETFKLGYKPLIRLHRSRRVLDAFLEMDMIGITGVAITNDDDRIVGNISISDLKDIGSSAENFSKLYLDCGTFIKQRETGSNVPPLVWANRKSTIKEVLGQFRAHNIHRVYVIESQTHTPVGVITTNDLISLFATILPPVTPSEQSRA